MVYRQMGRVMNNWYHGPTNGWISMIVKHSIRILLVVAMMLVIFYSLPTVAQAQDDFYIAIWVTDIVNGEGATSESETDATGDGELGKYAEFELSIGPNGTLDTSIPMPPPRNIDEFPEGPPPLEPDYIHIIDIDLDDPVILYWHWALPCEVGNDAQGDYLTFNVHYQIFPPDSGLGLAGEGDISWTFDDIKPCMSGTAPVILNILEPDGNGDITTTRGCELDIIILGDMTTVEVDCCNNSTYEGYIMYDPDHDNSFSIDRWTRITCGDCVGCGSFPLIIEMTPSEDSLPELADAVRLSPIYEFIGYRADEICSSVSFGKPVILLLKYDSSRLTPDITTVFIARYNPDTGEWEPLPQAIGRVAGAGEATAELLSLSTFAVYGQVGSSIPPSPPQPPAPTPAAPPPPVEPAKFVAGNLAIQPNIHTIGIGKPFIFYVHSGESVMIGTDVSNIGGQEGSYLANLEINGKTKAVKEVFIPPGQSKEIFFSVGGYEPGRHTVRVGDLSSEFQTTVWINWWLIAGVSTAFGLLIWLIWLYGHRHRKG